MVLWKRCCGEEGLWLSLGPSSMEPSVMAATFHLGRWPGVQPRTPTVGRAVSRVRGEGTLCLERQQLLRQRSRGKTSLSSTNTLEQYMRPFLCHSASYWPWASPSILVKNTTSLAPLLSSGLWPRNLNISQASRWFFWSGKCGSHCPRGRGPFRGGERLTFGPLIIDPASERT